MFAAEGASQGQEGLLREEGRHGGLKKKMTEQYGKYITLAVKSEPTERGIQMFPMGGVTLRDFRHNHRRMPPPGPIAGHNAREKHDGEIEYLFISAITPMIPWIWERRWTFSWAKANGSRDTKLPSPRRSICPTASGIALEG